MSTSPEETIDFEFTEYPLDGDLEVKTVLLGAQPVIMIEPTSDNGEDFVFKVKASDIDLEGAEYMLTLTLKALRKALEQEKEERA